MDWKDVLEELEEWFAEGTKSFEEAHTDLIIQLNDCNNVEEKAILLKKLRVMGFLRGVICWHQTTWKESSLPQSQ